MVTIDEIIRHRDRSRRRFNIIGFTNYSNWRPTKTCVIHRGNVLIPRRNLETGEEMPGLMCPQCGTPYTENEAPTDEKIKGKFSRKTKTNSEYKQCEDIYDKQTSRTIRTRRSRK